MSSKCFYFAIALLVQAISGFSQENILYERNIADYKGYFSDEYGIEYDFDNKFKDLDKYYVIWKVRKDPAYHSGGMYGPLFLSADNQCILAFPSRLVNINSHPYKKAKDILLFDILSEIKTSLGMYYSYGNRLNVDTVDIDVHDYLTVISGKKPREMFNADSMFIYDLPNADSVCFFDDSIEKLRRKKYPYCTSLRVQKKNRPVIDIKLFFTKRGVRNRNDYIDMLRGQIRFRNNFIQDKINSKE